MAQSAAAARSTRVGQGGGDRREIRGWILYSWAFHGFITSVATVLLGPYLTGLAQAAVGENGAVFGRDERGGGLRGGAAAGRRGPGGDAEGR